MQTIVESMPFVYNKTPILVDRIARKKYWLADLKVLVQKSQKFILDRAAILHLIRVVLL